MVVYYCPHCRSENRPGDKSCRRCGANMHIEGEDYVSMLIWALDHPEPQTPVRAATILGNLRERRAVDALVRLLENGGDPFLMAAATEALGKIGDVRAVSALAGVVASGGFMARLKAVESLGKLGGEDAQKALELAMNDPDSWVKEAATKILQRLDQEGQVA